MNILEIEKNQIMTRYQSIMSETKNAQPEEPKKMINGLQILEKYADEFEALMKMSNIIENGFKQSSDYEYLELRSKTNMNPLSDEMKSTLVNPELLKALESKMVSDRMLKISIEPLENDEKTVTASDGKEIKENLLEEYENLIKMSEIIKNNFSSNNYGDYAALRANTNLGAMSNNKYQILMSQRTLKVDETKTVQKDETTKKQENKSNVIGKIKSVKPWNYVKEHKKETLIALGVTALTVAVSTALISLIPTMGEAVKANEISMTANAMANNSTLWYMGTDMIKNTLHAANMGLSNALSNMTGLTTSFDSVTGVWTIGTDTLSEFATSAAAKAVEISSKVTGTGLTTAALGLGGMGAITAGLGIPQKKSEAYYSIVKSINALNSKIDELNQDQILETTQVITYQINTKTGLSDREKHILLKKIQKIIKKNEKNKVVANELQKEATPALFTPIMESNVAPVEEKNSIEEDDYPIMGI